MIIIIVTITIIIKKLTFTQHVQLLDTLYGVNT